MNRYIIIVLFAVLFFSSCEAENTRKIEYDSINRFEDQSTLIDKNELSDMKIKIDYQKPVLFYNKTTTEQIVDDELCNLTYDVKITNLSDQPIELIAKFFYTKKMYDTFLMSSDSFGTEGGAVTLEPSKGIYMAAGPLLRHTAKYTEKEHAIFNEEFEKLETILIINDREFHLLLDGDDTVDSIYED